MKRSAAKKTAAVAASIDTRPAAGDEATKGGAPPKVTAEERLQAICLAQSREICALTLNATSEMRALLDANEAMAAFEKALSERCGLAPPLSIAPDGTVTSLAKASG